MKLFVSLHVILLASSVSASPFTMALTRVQNNGAPSKGVAHASRSRAAYLKVVADGGLTPPNIPVTSFEYISYTARVGMGSPPTYYNLIVDTGSSNTFCGTGTPYVRTPTSVSTGEAVDATYGSGNFTGLEYLDRVTLAPGLVINNQSIGDALKFSGFTGVDGILGVGPVDLTRGTLSSDPNATIPTVMDNLVSQGLIENQVLGFYIPPATNVTDTNGTLTFGGIDPSLYEGEPTYVPITKTQPASRFWGINVTSCTYGSQSIIPISTAGIVDTGTMQVRLANDFFDTYVEAIPGSKFDKSTGALEIPHSSIEHMHSLTFSIGGKSFTLDVAAQLVPTSENEALGLPAEKQYGIIGMTGDNSGGGLDFILGQKFMERYYTVFDADENRVGFAFTNKTFSSYQG